LGLERSEAAISASAWPWQDRKHCKSGIDKKGIEASHRPWVNREGVAEQLRLLLAVVVADEATEIFEALTPVGRRSNGPACLPFAATQSNARRPQFPPA